MIGIVINVYYFIEGVSGTGKSTFVSKFFQDKEIIIIEGDAIKPYPFIDGRKITIEEYKKQHRDKLCSLDRIKSKDVVIVGGLLHGVEYDLIGVYDFDKQRVIQYIRDMVVYIPSDSQIIYLETSNIVENTKNILNERYLSRPDWIRGIFDYLSRVLYCQKMGWNGEEGFIKFVEMLYDCDKSILQEIKVDMKILVRKI